MAILSQLKGLPLELENPLSSGEFRGVVPSTRDVGLAFPWKRPSGRSEAGINRLGINYNGTWGVQFRGMGDYTSKWITAPRRWFRKSFHRLSMGLDRIGKAAHNVSIDRR